MTDVKKRHDDRLQPNKEQVRLAQSQTKDDHALQKLIKRVIEVTGCDETTAHNALVENGQNPDLAVGSILQNPTQNSWEESKSRKTKKQTAAKVGPNSGKVESNSRSKNDSNKFKATNRQRNAITTRTTSPSNTESTNKREQQQQHNRGPTEANRTRTQNRDQKQQRERTTGKTYVRKNDEVNKGAGENKKGNPNTSTSACAWSDKCEDQTQNDGWNMSSNSFAPTSNEDDWKALPSVYGSAMVESSSITTMGTSNWSNQVPVDSGSNRAEPAKKSFAAIVASKKQQPLVSTQIEKRSLALGETKSVEDQSTTNDGWISQSQQHNEQWASASNTDNWGNELQSTWGNANSVPNRSPTKPDSGFSASIGNSPLSVNQKLTEQLKNDMGLLHNVPTAPNVTQQPQQQQQQHQHLLANSISPQNEGQEAIGNPSQKVEFVSRNQHQFNSTDYQFGYHFDQPTNKTVWASPTNHISSIELDHSLKDNSTNSMATVVSFPTPETTTTSSASAQFSSVSIPHQNSSSAESNKSQPSLSYSVISCVNYPPNDGRMQSSVAGQTSTQASIVNTNGNIASNRHNMLPATTASTNMQQQQQQVYQTAAPQFSNYNSINNIPFHALNPALNVYSPVAGPAEVDRFLMQQVQQYPFATATALDHLPFSALSMASNQTALGNSSGIMAAVSQHQSQQRALQDQNLSGPNASYMDVNKFQHQSGINGSTNTGLTSNASYQQQSIGQQQRGISNVDGAILGTGGGVVAPPPGFGMPTQQPTYVPQPTNVQSLFQMPTYTHPMSAYPHTPFHIVQNRMQAQHGRMAQTSPPENMTGVGGRQMQSIQLNNRQRQGEFSSEHHSLVGSMPVGAEHQLGNASLASKRYHQYSNM